MTYVRCDDINGSVDEGRAQLEALRHKVVSRRVQDQVRQHCLCGLEDGRAVDACLVGSLEVLLELRAVSALRDDCCQACGGGGELLLERWLLPVHGTCVVVCGGAVGSQGEHLYIPDMLSCVLLCENDDGALWYMLAAVGKDPDMLSGVLGIEGFSGDTGCDVCRSWYMGAAACCCCGCCCWFSGAVLVGRM